TADRAGRTRRGAHGPTEHAAGKGRHGGLADLGHAIAEGVLGPVDERAPVAFLGAIPRDGDVVGLALQGLELLHALDEAAVAPVAQVLADTEDALGPVTEHADRTLGEGAGLFEACLETSGDIAYVRPRGSLLRS